MDGKENFLTGETYVNFRSFYIVRERQGGGAAKALLERGMEFCRETGAKSVVGKVRVSNLPMRALYKSFGFEATHITMEHNFSGTEANNVKMHHLGSGRDGLGRFAEIQLRRLVSPPGSPARH